MIQKKNVKRYCKEEPSKIENYDKAIADTDQMWHLHHRRETIYTRKGLIEIGEYYHRPAAELIFLTKAEHTRIHSKGKRWSLGRRWSDEHREKLSKRLIGHNVSQETRDKIRKTKTGASNGCEGRILSNSTRQKIGAAHIGLHWYNNGVKNVLSRECPSGFVPGRM